MCGCSLSRTDYWWHCEHPDTLYSYNYSSLRDKSVSPNRIHKRLDRARSATPQHLAQPQLHENDERAAEPHQQMSLNLRYRPVVLSEYTLYVRIGIPTYTCTCTCILSPHVYASMHSFKRTSTFGSSQKASKQMRRSPKCRFDVQYHS